MCLQWARSALCQQHLLSPAFVVWRMWSLSGQTFPASGGGRWCLWTSWMIQVHYRGRLQALSATIHLFTH